MVIEKDKVVSISYELKLTNGNGDVVENVNKNNPLVFLLGHGNLLPKFETKLTGLKIGDNFDFVLNAEEAYGKISSEAIVDLPKSIFMADGVVNEDLLYIGNIIPMTDQSGNRFNGKVINLSDAEVKMDFNHPLAGESLHFKGEVVDVRDASGEELEHGHIHQEQSSCGCGGGSCGCDDASCESGACETEAAGSCGCGSGCGCN
jgi:FKBP-type peptidyl-prolyl cis-trans isomerase SlyD